MPEPSNALFIAAQVKKLREYYRQPKNFKVFAENDTTEEDMVRAFKAQEKRNPGLTMEQFLWPSKAR
jgi:hypothetical protein